MKISFFTRLPYRSSILYCFFLLFLACGEEKSPESNAIVNPISVSTLATNIKEAQVTYDQSVAKSANLRQATSNKKSLKTRNKKVFWNEARIETINDEKRLVIPFELEDEIFVNLPDGQRLSYSQTSYFTAYKKNGAYKFEVITQLPDLDFLSYGKTMKDFSGTILIDDEAGNFLKGFKVKNRQYYPLSKPENSPNARKMDQAFCTTVDWFSCASANGGASWDCSYMYTETICDSSGGSPVYSSYGVTGQWTPMGGGSGAQPDYSFAPFPEPPANQGDLCPPSANNFKRVDNDWFINLNSVGLSVEHQAHPGRFINAEVVNACFSIPSYDMPASACSVAITNAINYARSRVGADLNSQTLAPNPTAMRMRLIQYIEESLGQSNPGYTFTKHTCPGSNMPTPVQGNYNC